MIVGDSERLVGAIPWSELLSSLLAGSLGPLGDAHTFRPLVRGV
jgi:hypothetical protein